MPKVIELALGAALLSQLILILLWFGWAAPWVVAALFFFGVLVWAWRVGRPRLQLRRADLVFVPLVILYLIYALAPPTASDAIGYHLGLATEWLRSASFARSAVGFYDALPHGMETLFMAGAAIGGLTGATLVHFAFLLATLPLIVAVAARLGFDGRPAALLYFATPVVAMTGTSAYVDAALVFYTLAAFWLLLADELAWAGIAVGFCYAIKMSAGPAVLAACLYLLVRRSWRGLALAAAMIVPWLAHAWWLSGNPVAPMLATVFPSPSFYPKDVADWVAFVRSYTPWREQWREVTIGGGRAQGLLGPMFLLAPVALLALRRRKLAVLVLAAGVCGAGWFLNTGTRFLMPAAAFVALAMTAVLPLRVAWAVAVAQAISCWPVVLDRYVPADAWRLSPTWPWRAALRIESEPEYLRRVNPDYLVARMVNRRVRPNERVLDFGETPRGYVHGAEMLASWQYTPARRAVVALLTAHSDDRDRLELLTAKWPRRRLRSIRFELLSPSADPWSILEVRFWRGGERVFPSRAWELDARPIPWEAPLAFDRNSTSGWQTWEPRRVGMYLEIAGSIEADGVELVSPAGQQEAQVRITGIDEQGARVELPRPQRRAIAAPLNLRLEAMRYVRREGFRWILAQRSSADNRRLGRALVEDAGDWDLEPVEEVNGIVLLRIK